MSTPKVINPLCVYHLYVIDMDSNKYSQVSIPKAIFLKLTKLVGHHGFRSTAEVVMHCIRKNEFQVNRMLREIEEENVLHDIKET